jgi:hypothetical protein
MKEALERWGNVVAGGGDFRPLAAAIREGGALDDAILGMLAKMIDDGRLKLDRKGKGHRPKDPATMIKGIVAGLAYDHGNVANSDERFRRVAEMLVMGEKTVRGHVTAWEKAKKKYAERMKSP